MIMINTEEIFNILGNETRRMILEMLADKPCYTTEIAERLNIGQKAINEHLKIMQELGLIEVYVKKQKRGSPRKYFRISNTFKLEFTLTPSIFDVDVLRLDRDFDTIFDYFPEFKELMREVRETKKVAEMERLRIVAKDLREELEKINNAKIYIENLLGEIRKRCFDLLENMDLEEMEKKILMEVVTSGGKSTIQEIAEKCKCSIEDVRESLISLERKKVVRL